MVKSPYRGYKLKYYIKKEYADMDMEKYNEWPAKHKGDSNPSKEILKLGKKITDVAAHMVGGVNANDPESLMRRWQRFVTQ